VPLARKNHSIYHSVNGTYFKSKLERNFEVKLEQSSSVFLSFFFR